VLGFVLPVVLILACSGERRARQDTAMGAEPRIAGRDSMADVVIPTALTQALAAAAPDFRPFRRRDFTPAVLEFTADQPGMLFAVVGDFDGDGRKDVALWGERTGGQYLIAVLNTSGAPQVVTVDSFPVQRRDTAAWNDDFIRFTAPGKIEIPSYLDSAETTNGQSRPFVLAHDGIELIYLGKAGVLYYYEGGRFRSIATGD
jgi:hypothetical protein